jgi:hypothetical protein
VKRGCLIVLIAVPTLIIIAGAYAYHRVSQSVGLSAAEPISHETLATPETRVRVVFKRDNVIPFLKGFLPDGKVAVPWYASFFVTDPIEELIPYEAAILGGANYKDNVYGLTLFVNERVGGPGIAPLVRTAIEQQAQNFNANPQSPESQLFKLIKWQDGYISNDRRGELTMRAGLPLPAGMQNRVLRTWKIDKQPSQELIDGSSLLELAVDNKGGDLMTLIGTLGKLQGQTLDQVLMVGLSGSGAPSIVEQALKSIDDIRITANLTGDDELTIIASIALNTEDFMVRAPFQAITNAVIDGSSMLETLASMGQRTVTPDQAAFKGLKHVLEPYGMDADFRNGEKPVFSADDPNTLIASYVITGFRPLIQTQLDAALQQLAALQ